VTDDQAPPARTYRCFKPVNAGFNPLPTRSVQRTAGEGCSGSAPLKRIDLGGNDG
jgi:hypothetical protein